MGQTWYIQYEDRTVGPLSGRQLHALSRAGELTPDQQVSLDGRSWFRASKVIGLFAEPGAEAPASSSPAADLALKPGAVGDAAGDTESYPSTEDAPRTRDPSPDFGHGFGGAEGKTRVDLGEGRGAGGPEGKTRVDSFAGSIVGDERPARGAAVALAIAMFGWRTLRALTIAGTLVLAWVVRSGVGLARRRKVPRTRLESRMSASLWGGSGSVVSSGSRPLPERFGRYQVLRPLGEGGMGTVYLALDTQLGRQVALKVPRSSPEDGPEVLERFDREARAAAMIDHPNVCPIFDVGAIDGIPYASMAYVEGRPLADLVDADKRLAEREAAALVRKVAIAMAEAHAKGIVHRDLKPANIMINPRREPVIMDFGLARRPGMKDSKLTRDGAIVGTPAYMSPEQVGGDPSSVGPSCDIYSLGVVLYELLTARLPFEGPVMAVLGQILSAEPAPPSAHRPEVDHQLEAICRKAMAKSAGDRFGSMGDFARALTSYLKAHPQEDGVDDAEDVVSWSEFFALPDRPAGDAGPPGHHAAPYRWPLRAVAASIVLLAGAVGYLAWRGREPGVAPAGSSPIVVASSVNPTVVQTTVNVTLVNYQVTQTTIVNVTYYLDGKPVDPVVLNKPMPLSTGEHIVEARGPEGQSQTWAFAVSPGDDQRKLDIRRAPAEASEDVREQVDGLLDPDPGVRKLAAEQLEKLRSPASVPALINRVADDVWFDSGFINVPSDPVAGGKVGALEALQKLAPDRVPTALIRASRSVDGRVRLWALQTLGRERDNARNPEVVAAVVAMLQDKDNDTERAKDERNLRRLAAELLRRWKVTSAVPALADRVADDLWYDSGYTNVPSDPEGGGKGAALDALRALAPDRVTPTLLRALGSPTVAVRLWALETLGGNQSNARNPEVVNAVAALLTDPDNDWKRAKAGRNPRRVAAECLKAWKATSAVPALADRVADDLWYVSGYNNVPSDPEGGGKGAALDALRALAPDRVKPALQAARKSSNAEVRRWALAELGPKT